MGRDGLLDFAKSERRLPMWHSLDAAFLSSMLATGGKHSIGCHCSVQLP